MNAKLRWRMRAQNGVFVLLLAAIVSLLAYFAHEYAWQRDLTQNGRNTLSHPARELLGRLPGAVQVTVYASEESARGKHARTFLAPYQQAKPDIGLSFVDPRADPKRVQDAGVRFEGEAVIAYHQKTEHLAVNQYNEQAFVNALQRLAHAGEHVIMVLSGHGERRIDGPANHDLGLFGKQLADKGYRTLSLNLAIAQQVPANAAALVIAAPQVNLQPAETEKIEAYIKHGGNLLWLIDPEPLHGLQPLAEQLGLVLGPGTVIDPTLKVQGGAPVFAIGSGYGRHPVIGTLQLNTLFPFARQIGINSDTEGGEWRTTPLIEVAQRGWVETGKLDADASFDKARDIPGPVTIAYAFEREVEDHPQRIVVIGNGNFLANQYLGNGGNLDLGVNMVNWLSGEDSLITIQPRPVVDGELDLGIGAHYFILFVFLLILPLTFIVMGVAIWWRRRKP